MYGNISLRPERTQPECCMRSFLAKLTCGSGSGLALAYYRRSCRAAWPFRLVSRGGVSPSLRSRPTCPGLARSAPLARRHHDPQAVWKRQCATRAVLAHPPVCRRAGAWSRGSRQAATPGYRLASLRLAGRARGIPERNTHSPCFAQRLECSEFQLLAGIRVALIRINGK